jgi:hypothetical protein
LILRIIKENINEMTKLLSKLNLRSKRWSIP